MSDARRSETQSTCESCGKDPASTTPDADAAPITHCEWCGAEYPTPKEDASPASEPPTT